VTKLIVPSRDLLTRISTQLLQNIAISAINPNEIQVNMKRGKNEIVFKNWMNLSKAVESFGDSKVKDLIFFLAGVGAGLNFTPSRLKGEPQRSQ